MTLLAEAGAARLFANPAVAPNRAYGADEAAILGRADFDAAAREIAAWPGYGETPLTALVGLARAAGLGAIHYKDEAGRFGLGSFKALGGAYAVYRLLARHVAGEVSAADLAGGAYRAATSDITVCSATDGNHGRSVAWGAATFGCRAVIYIHETVSEGRREAIAGYGAEVVRTPGSYDDSVRRAAADAAANGWFVVSDTSYEGYTEIPRQVMQGYGVMADEAIRQWSAEMVPGDAAPSHVFLQGGVGGMAAAVAARLWQHFGGARPRFVVVEPERAACLYESARAGRPVALDGDIDTLMAGLACGEPSLVAWPLLRTAIQDFMTVPDQAAVAVMRLLADGDPPLVAGESAVAGLAGALAAAARPELAEALGLDGESRILVFGTEGATDPELYRELVGRPPETVLPAGARSA